ncbi:MAG: hypothetical protein ABIZ80_13045 [Bryobacteraceae bacterium]
MANAGKRAIAKVLHLLDTPAGLTENLGAVSELEGIELPEITLKQVFTHNVSQELVERSVDLRYPTLHLYCERVSNTLREKFRTFSGSVQMALEVRVSHDRLEGLDQRLQVYVDVVTRILDQNRGDWGSGMFYTGGYEALFEPVKRGGKNFIQTGKVRFEVLVSVD